jgi:DNA-binding response OmpR family regulator
MLKFNDITMPTKVNFLILEDIVESREIIIEQIKSFGFEGQIYEASNVNDGCEILKNSQVDFILSDWDFGTHESGHDFLKTIRLNSATSSIPFIMITGKDSIDDMLLATKNGADDYLVKPWSEAELREKIFSSWSARY